MNEKMMEIDASRFDELVLKSDKPVVVDFFSTECAPCEALATKYEGAAELYGDDIRFIKIFRQGNRELAANLGVTSSPSVMFYRDGQRTGEFLTGGIKRADLERNLDGLLSADRVATLKARRQPRRTECDVLILGGGPAGLTAGIYLAQARLRTIVVDIQMAGGNVAITHTVSNFPGFPEPQPGWALADHMQLQAKNAGAEFREAVDITRIDLHKKEIEIDGLETIQARRILVATGSSPRPLGIVGEREYKGRGLSYCATCDAKYYQDRDVIVIGGGNSAIEEALFITKFARSVTIVHQFDHLQANKTAQEKAFANEKIKFVLEHEPRAFIAEGQETVNRVEVEDLKTHERKVLATDGVFIFVGMQPNLEGFANAFELDNFGYVKVDDAMHTSVPGVFAIGDVRSKRYRQLTTAVNDGTIAAMAVSSEIEADAPAKPELAAAGR